jgi:hypothetical protein
MTRNAGSDRPLASGSDPAPGSLPSAMSCKPIKPPRLPLSVAVRFVWSCPVNVFGSESTKTISRGYL